MPGQGRAKNLRVRQRLGADAFASCATLIGSEELSRFTVRARSLRQEKSHSALECTLTGGFLCAVRRPRLVMGITTGIVPAAATTGMLLGYGLRLGAASRVFQAIGAVLIGTAGESVTHSSLAAIVGIVLHVAATLACGVAYVAFGGDSEDHRIAWAIAIGAAVSALAFLAVRTFAGSIALVLTPGNLIAIGAVIAITLPIGMRLAPTRL